MKTFQEVIQDVRPKIIMMVGLPACGKSTWASQFTINKPDWVIRGTDAIIDQFAKNYDFSYNTAFEKLNSKEVENEFISQVKNDIKYGKNIILDQTNLSAKSRRKKFRKIEPTEDYILIALNFKISEEVRELQVTMRKNKIIPEKIVDQMKSYMSYPEEGDDIFDYVFNINQIT